MNQRYSNMLSFAGFACAILCFAIGLYLVAQGQWALLCLDTALLFMGLAIFLRDVLLTWQEIHRALYRIIHLHRGGN